jgi:hypothetical protein
LCPFVSGPVVFIRGRIHSKSSTKENKSLAVAFNSTFRYIDDVLSNNNDQFDTYFNSIYPNELEIKETTEYSIFRYVIEIAIGY